MATNVQESLNKFLYSPTLASEFVTNLLKQNYNQVFDAGVTAYNLHTQFKS
jgi:hypothetical protein